MYFERSLIIIFLDINGFCMYVSLLRKIIESFKVGIFRTFECRFCYYCNIRFFITLSRKMFRSRSLPLCRLLSIEAGSRAKPFLTQHNLGQFDRSREF